MIDALIKANDHITFNGKTVSQCVKDMEAYTKLTDSVFDLIKLDPRPELKEAQEILERVEKRQLYKCLGKTRPLKEDEFKKVRIYIHV
jgi:hypothetical protein